MVAYADTSFLFSLYAQDANTHKAAHIGKSLRTPIAITPYHRLELKNAFRLSVFRGQIDVAECQRLIDLIEADIKSGALLETPVSWAEVYSEAEALSAAHTPQLGTRSFDILHVASAAALGVKNFYTFDARQKALAQKAGMNVRP